MGLKQKILLKAVVWAERFVESQKHVEQLERDLEELRILLQQARVVSEQYRPYYDNSLAQWRKHTNDRIELVQDTLGLPDLFAWDVVEEDVKVMLSGCKHPMSPQVRVIPQFGGGEDESGH